MKIFSLACPFLIIFSVIFGCKIPGLRSIFPQTTEIDQAKCVSVNAEDKNILEILDTKYLGKCVQMTGNVDNIYVYRGGSISFGFENPKRNIKFSFFNDKEPDLSDLTKGQRVTVRGICCQQRYNDGITLVPSEIVK